MPAQVNGIGTTYIGKHDLQVQQGVCESCKGQGPLSSYETRLWFTVVFVPIIPLARQQILSYCPRCTRHRVMPIDKWREVQASAIREAMAGAEANSDSPERAVDCHATLAACGKRVEAAQYADVLASRFSNNADVLMYLGGWFERIGQPQRADKFFEQALAADPEHLGALRAGAIGLLQAGRPREAEAMLAPLVPPSKEFEPSVFVMLAKAYQSANDHAAAARLFKMVADVTPSAAKDKGFRKAVVQSEAALGQYGSVLAPIPWYRRPAVWWSALAAAVVVGVIVFDRLYASNQEVFVVNGLSKPLKVRVDSGEPIEVPADGKRMLQAAEGQHKIAVIEPAALAREEDFTVGGSVIGRWGGGQVHIVDPARSAIVVWEESVYAANARDQRGDFKIHAGEPFATYQHIDYKFQEFPNSLRVENKSKSVTKHRVGLVKLNPLELLLTKPESLPGETRLDFLEAHLATTEKPDSLLEYYWLAGAQQDQLDRCCTFLKKSLGVRPIDVDWHRMYQTASERNGKGETLAAEYDAMLTKEPDNSDLLYLRGRIEPFSTDSAKYYDRATMISANHGFAWSAKAYLLNAAGRFEEGLEAIDKAIAAESERGEWKSLRHGVLHALGRHDQVVKELRSSAPAGKELELAQYPALVNALAIGGNIDEAESMYAKFVQAVDREWPEDPLQLKLKSRLVLLLYSKKYDESLAASQQITDSTERAVWNFGVQLNAGKLDDAASSNESALAMTRGLGALCLCVGWRNAHNDAKAQSSLKQAVELFAKGSREEQIVAGWLREPPADLATLLPKLTDLASDPDDKVIVLLALAGGGGQNREKLIDFAKRLSVWPSTRKAFVEATLAGVR